MQKKKKMLGTDYDTLDGSSDIVSVRKKHRMKFKEWLEVTGHRPLDSNPESQNATAMSPPRRGIKGEEQEDPEKTQDVIKQEKILDAIRKGYKKK